MFCRIVHTVFISPMSFVFSGYMEADNRILLMCLKCDFLVVFPEMLLLRKNYQKNVTLMA